MICEALLYEKISESRVRCFLCAHRCKIDSGRRGLCGVRENKDGVLYSLVFGTLIAENVDPIEKKPFFHVYPGSRSYSVATMGCNFSCVFCQNSEISQTPRKTLMIMGQEEDPEVLVERALKNECRTISYTYTEPTVYLETALAVARVSSRNGLKNLFVTNGYMTKEALGVIGPYLSAANVDLKSFRDDFYRKQCGAQLKPVLESLEIMKKSGIWLEITTLLIPGLNDSEEELNDIAAFIAGLGKEIPWHISRFHPQYKMSAHPVTPATVLHRACAIGKKAGLKYVYSGNIPGDDRENTYCARCSEILINRNGYRIIENHLSGTACSYCGHPLDGLF